MNKWEDSFKKPLTNDNKNCSCSSNQGLFIHNRQLSALVAGLLLLLFSVFITGYFLGKKKSAEQFTQEMRQDALVDHIYSSVLVSSCASSSQECTGDDSLVLSQSINQDVDTVQDNAIASSDESPRYYAQLIGFGTEKAAQLFVNKLAARGIETELKKRVSKTAQGRTSYWYQVVTAEYSNKTDLLALVDKLAKEENIKDACIRSC